MTSTDAPTAQRPTPRRRWGLGQRRNVIIGIVLVAGFALGMGLVLIPDDDTPSTKVETDGSAAGSSTDGAGTLPAPEPLDIDDTSLAAVAELTSLAFPGSVEQFQTATTKDRTQLDVTFTIPTADEAAFLTESGLPEPAEGERTILHSSPLWKLNADGETAFRGTADTTDTVRRAVELVPEGDGRSRVRIVITAA